MATKLQIMTGVYEETLKRITQNHDSWTSFLKTAANNYKYSFPEQVLIYAQKPDATACAEITVWNEKFNRWVNRGASGIALFDSNSYQKLRYVFDVSDTNSRYDIALKLWEMKDEYNDEVADALVNAFGEPMSDGNLAWIIEETAKNIVADNNVDYVSAITDLKYGSFLEELDELNIEKYFTDTLSASVGYMLMSRCGINPDDYYFFEDFEDIYNFNTRDTVIILGSAVSSMSEMGLREIETTVRNLQKTEKNKNRTFVNSNENDYDKAVSKNTQVERSENYVTDNLQESGRLSDSQHYDSPGGEERYTWQVRNVEEGLPQESQRSDVQPFVDEGRTDTTSQGNRNASREDDGTVDFTDGTERGRDGTDEVGEPNALGSDDEQHQTRSGGTSAEGHNLQLSNHNFNGGNWNGIEYFHQNKEKNELIKLFLEPHKEEIASFYESHFDSKERSNFIKTFFNSQPFERVLANGTKAGFAAFSDAIYFWRTDKEHPERECWERWHQISSAVYGMILLEQWTDIEPLLLPTYDNQFQLFGNDEKVASLPIPQAAFDYILGCGSGFSEGKMRIYRYFTEQHTKDERLAFLKNEYGTGGGSDAIPGSGYWGNHDSKGIEITDHYSNPPRRIIFKWNEVEKRLSDLIRLDRYLNPKEKEAYTQWLVDKLTEEEEREKSNKIRQIIREAPEENQPVKEYKYEYHLGDTVYIGSDEYSVLSFDDTTVVLNDAKYPLFTKELPRDVFDRRVKETSGNEHLKVEIEPTEPTETDKKVYKSKDGFYEYSVGSNVVIDDDVYEIISVDDRYVDLKDIAVPTFLMQLEVADFEDKLKSSFLNDQLKVDESNKPDFLVQYEQVKKENPDGVLLMHTGGFYFAFGDDAQTITKYTHHTAPKKNFYGNVFIPCCQVLDFNLSYCQKELCENNNINIVIMEFDKGVVDRIPTPSVEESKDEIITEREVLYAVLDKLNINDIELSYKGDILYATDGDNEWNGNEIYEFLIDEAFVFNDDGSVLGIDEALLEKFKVNAELNDVEFKDNRYNPLYRGYLAVKNEEPDKIVLYQVGDFFEAFNDDAKVVAEALDLTLTSRPISDTERATLVGFPKHSLETYLNMLTDRGHDIILSSVENGERKETTIISTNKEDPVESKPVGRIDYLAFNGKVRESIEYTSEYKFVKDIKEENYYGVPMSIYVYADKDGKAIGRSFVSSLDPPPLGFKVIPSPYLQIDERSDVDDSFDDINPAVIRENLAERGIVNGEVVDAEAHNNSPFIQQVMSDVESDEPSYTTEITDVLPAEENGMPFDVVFQTLKVNEPKEKATTLKPDIPESEKHDFKITDDNLGIGGAKEKFKNNMAAINLLHELEFDDRLATPEEQEILSKYVGFGGLADAFDETKDSWKNEFTELYTALSPEEYASARESTLTAFYTPPVVIKSMYQALENMGFKTGNILEPSCGVGNFIGLKPDSMADSKIYGVELDGLTGRIAQQLYQKSNIAVQGYEQTNLPDSFFDVAIGNVPFGQFKVNDKKYNNNNWLVHDYFFGKTLDKVRPGGVIAFITSSGTMDKQNSNVRRYIAQRADLLGAIRLPNNTFKANAGTEVVSDIIFLQKRDTLAIEEPNWVYVGKDENGHELNQYFIDNPDMVLGELTMESSQFGQSLTCKPHEDADLSELLNGAIQNIHAEIKEIEIDDAEEPEFDLSIPADPTVKNFSFTVKDGVIYYRANSRMNPVNVSKTAENRIKGMIEIRDCVRQLITLQTEDYPDSAIISAQDRLNTLYDDFTKKYGLLNSRGNKLVFSDDDSYYLLCSLEEIDENGNLKRKADMFSKRTIKPHIAVTSVNTPSEALAVSIGEKARIDMPYMSELTGKTELELFDSLKGVIFLNPEKISDDDGREKYLMADEYLSGNVREKLAVAKKTAEFYPEDYTVNVEALQKVQPAELSAGEISVRLGATWIPERDIQAFIFELLQTPRYVQYNVKVHYSNYTADWNIENKTYDKGNVIANTTYGTDRINAYKIIEETLNLKDVRIFDYIEDENGNRKPVLNKKETAIAQGKQELIKQAFKDWIWKDPERRQRLVKLYNEKFNSMRAREYDGSHITFSGMNPEITLRPHQKNAVARIMYGGNSLLAHVVGAGKTFEIVAAAQESKRLGLCNKSLVVVPNHLTEQWASEYLQLYPSANILVATKKDFETKNRKKFCARIATGDYDAIIIGHSQFEKIPLSYERQRIMLEDQIGEITQGIAEVKSNRGERFTVKQLEKTKKSLQNRLDKLNDQSRKDDVVTFEELGVDRLFVDEAHFYKNLFLYTKMRNVGGIAQTEAQKSSDLYMKCHYLDEITEGKGVIFATGTPVSNSMVELYTMQRYLQYDALEEKGLQHFDAWASTFGETVTAIELAPEGTGYRAKTRFAKFYNLPELMMMFRQIADIQTADMLKLPVPEAIRKNIAIEPSEMQKEIVSSLAERAERVRNRMVDSSIDNMLLITNDGRKLALDQRLTNEMLPDDPNGKVATCANNVYDIWDKTKEQKSTQLVFCDLSTPHNDDKFNVYDDLKKKLIEKGIPENEIAFIHSAETEAKKKDLFSKVRSGQVRVLMGSTFKMGAGTNVQQKLIAEHHLDCPWRPADLQQREGRIIRQGNENPQVEIYTYVTKETFDSYLYQLVENKQKFIGQIMTSKSPVRSAEDVDEQALSYAEIKALATGNPYIKEKMDLDVSVAKLTLLRQNHLNQRYALEDRLMSFFPSEIKTWETVIAAYGEDVQTAAKHTVSGEDEFSPMVVEETTYTDKKGAGSAILSACKGMTSPEPKIIGSYRGFDLELSFKQIEKEYVLSLVGEMHHPITLGPDVLGNITRIDNAIAKFPDNLEKAKMQLEETHKQMSNAEEQIKVPFPQEDELKQKTERLAELNALLDMDHKDNEIVDDGRENDDVPDKMQIRDDSFR